MTRITRVNVTSLLDKAEQTLENHDFITLLKMLHLLGGYPFFYTK